MDNNIKGFEMMRLLTLEAKTERKKIDWLLKMTIFIKTKNLRTERNYFLC